MRSEPEYNVTRALTVVLSEEEWRQFRSLEPQPVAWLRERIREHIRTAGASDEVTTGTSATGH